jgi:hypothetical protein
VNKTILPLLIAAGGLLAACGKVGYLEQPAPLWDQKAKADFRAHRPNAANPGMSAPTPPPAALEPPQPGAATPVPAARPLPPSPPLPPEPGPQ